MLNLRSWTRPPRWTRSLRFQLTSAFLAAVALVLLLAGALGYGLVRASLVRETDRALADAASQIGRGLGGDHAEGKDRGEAGDAEAPPDPVALVAGAHLAPAVLPGVGADALLLRLARRDTGRTLALSPGTAARPDLRAVLLRLPACAHRPWFAGDGDDDRLRALCVPVPGTPDVLLAAVAWDPAEDLLARLLLGLSGAALLFLLLSGVGSWLLVGRALRPMGRIVAEAEGLTADRLAPGPFSPRAPSDSEIGHLVQALNRMLTRLSDAFSAQRRFAEDASHELKTPLTILRGELELALSRPRPAADYEKALRSGLEETLRLSRIVEGLALLARGDAAAPTPDFAVVPLGALAQEVAASFMAQAEEAGLRLTCRAEAGPGVMGDPDALRRLLQNLVGNALAYTPRGGAVSVSVARDGAQAVLEVADTGIGIAPDDLPRLFDRFFRADRARANPGGSGLGLAIAQSIARAHGGRVLVESIPNQGSRFTVTLPTAQQADAD